MIIISVCEEVTITLVAKIDHLSDILFSEMKYLFISVSHNSRAVLRQISESPKCATWNLFCISNAIVNINPSILFCSFQRA